MFNFLWQWLFIIIDAPRIPWGMGKFGQDSLASDPHSNRLARLLEQHEPELFQRWRWVVDEAARQATRLQEQLDRLIVKNENLLAQISKLETLAKQLDPFGEKPKESPWAHVLTIGLSLMLFLGICQFMGIEIGAIRPDQYPLVPLALAGAVCMNIAEKIGVQQNLVKPNQAPLLLIGACALIVIMETCFAAPGMVGLLPPSASRDPMFKVIVIAGTGLFAFGNVLMALGHARQLMRWEEKHIEMWAKYEDWMVRKQADSRVAHILFTKYQELTGKASAARARQQDVVWQIKQLEKRVGDAKERARLEHERWELMVRRWYRKYLKQQNQTSSPFADDRVNHKSNSPSLHLK